MLTRDIAARWRQRKLHGQIVQYPGPEAPGVLVSPFWDVGERDWDELSNVLRYEGDLANWYIIMGDTCYRNFPPPYMQPYVRARFCVDDPERDFFQKYAPHMDMLHLCQSHVLDENVYRPLSGIEKEFDLVYVARFGWIKRHIELIDALEALHARGHVLKTLFMYYDKDDEDTRNTTAAVRARLAASPIDVTLYTTGGRGNQEATVVQMLNKCRFGVHMSPWEGPSLVFAEYLLCDLPIVADANFRGGGLYFLDETNSLLFTDLPSLPDVLLRMSHEYTRFTPRASAFKREIGVAAGNERFRRELQRHGIMLTTNAVPLKRNLDNFPLRALLSSNAGS